MFPLGTIRLNPFPVKGFLTDGPFSPFFEVPLVDPPSIPLFPQPSVSWCVPSGVVLTQCD